MSDKLWTDEDRLHLVRIWQSSESLGDVAAKTGYRKSQISYQIQLMRENGVPLKKMKRRNLGISNLKELCEAAKEPQHAPKED